MAQKPEDQRHWLEVASEWIAWARAPNHDAFWAYRKAFNDFVGEGSGNALEVGCGEGHRQRFQTTDQHNGLAMRFAGWSQPLQDYAFALECAGLAITRIKNLFLRRMLRMPISQVGHGSRCSYG